MSEPEILSKRITITLKYGSWSNLIDCIRSKQTKVKIKGNFWASIHAIEAQIDDAMDMPV